MKNNCLVVLLSCLLFTACSKSADELSASDEATVHSVRYPCGPACTALGWVLKTSAGTTYEPVNLPNAFELDELPVKVTYSKTGRRATPGSGTGEELITIRNIARR